MKKYNLKHVLTESDYIDPKTLSNEGEKALNGLKRQVGGGKAQKAVAAAIEKFGRKFTLADINIVDTSNHNTDVFVDPGGDEVPCEAKANSGTFDISRFLAAADKTLKPKGKSKRKSYANHSKYNSPKYPPPAPPALVKSSAAKIIALDEFICITNSGLSEMYAVYVPECQEHGAVSRNSPNQQAAIKKKLFGNQASKIPTISASMIASKISGSWRYVEKNKNGKKTWSWRFELAITKSILEDLGAKQIDLKSVGIDEVQIHIDFFTSYVSTNKAQIDARDELANLCGVSAKDLTNLALTFDANGSSAMQSIYHKSSKRYLPVVLNPKTYPTYGAAFKKALPGMLKLASSSGFSTSTATPSSSNSVLSNAGVPPVAEEEIANAVETGQIEHESDWEESLTELTKKELLLLARSLDIRGRYGMPKDTLFDNVKASIAALIEANDTEALKQMAEETKDINIFKLALAEAVIETDKTVVGIDIPTVVATIKRLYLDDNKDLTRAPKGAYGSIKKMLGDKILKIDGSPMNTSFSKNLRKFGDPKEYDDPDFDLTRFSESKYSLKRRLLENPMMDMEYIDDVNSMPEDVESLENIDDETKEILGDVLLDGIFDGSVTFV